MNSHVAGPVREFLRWTPPAYTVLLLLALVAFWPGYLALPKLQFSGWLHLHVVSATLWMLLLIGQPLAIRFGHRKWHRTMGRASPILMVIVLVGFIGLAHSTLQGKTGAAFALGAYFFYIRVVLVSIFAATYILGMINRHVPAVHARYMACTGLALVDPVVHRLAHRFIGSDDVDYQLITFGLVCAVLVMLIIAERNARSGRQVFPLVLAAFVIAWIPLAFDFSSWGWPWEYWKALTKQFAAWPLT